jgi:hypothetical protein
MALLECGDMAATIPWRRVLVEGAVIVGSILLALFLEAWMADREVRREVSADLVGIDSELESNLSLLDFDLDLLRRTVAASGSLVESLAIKRLMRSPSGAACRSSSLERPVPSGSWYISTIARR